jgi:phosphoribosyl 1,2-cyclic phosphate phosphodiesterase
VHVAFLGTGASEGIPGLFCVCELCMQARRRGGRNVRSRSQQCIARRVLVDWPPDTFAHVQAAGIQLEQIDHILFTHGHRDHCYLDDLLVTRREGFSTLRDGPPLHVWAEPYVLERLAAGSAEPLQMVPHEVKPFEPFDLGDGLICAAIRAHHGSPDAPAVNYLFEDAQSVYLAGNDTGWYDPPTWAHLCSRQRPITAAALDCTDARVERPREVGHLGISLLLALRQEMVEKGVLADGAAVFATHIGHNGGMLHESLEAAFSGTGVVVTYDGLAVEL